MARRRENRTPGRCSAPCRFRPNPRSPTEGAREKLVAPSRCSWPAAPIQPRSEVGWRAAHPASRERLPWVSFSLGVAARRACGRGARERATNRAPAAPCRLQRPPGDWLGGCRDRLGPGYLGGNNRISRPHPDYQAHRAARRTFRWTAANRPAWGWERRIRAPLHWQAPRLGQGTILARPPGLRCTLAAGPQQRASAGAQNARAAPCPRGPDSIRRPENRTPPWLCAIASCAAGVGRPDARGGYRQV